MRVGARATKLAFGLVRSDTQVRAAATAGALTVVATIAAIAAITGLATSYDGRGVSHYVMLLASAAVISFVGVFATAVISVIVLARLDGSEVTWGEAASRAWEARRPLVAFALLQLTVGALLRFLASRVPFGWVPAIMGDLAWAAATVMVVPVLVAEQHPSSKAAVKRSAGLFRKAFGEATSGLVFSGAALLLMVIPLMFGGILIAAQLDLLWFAIGWAAAISIVMLTTAMGVRAVLVTVLYRYSTTGQLPEGWDAASLATR